MMATSVIQHTDGGVLHIALNLDGRLRAICGRVPADVSAVTTLSYGFQGGEAEFVARWNNGPCKRCRIRARSLQYEAEWISAVEPFWSPDNTGALR